eukprot:Gb_02420 [translate_table: standard]
MGKLGAVSKKAWNALKAVVKGEKEIVKSRGAVVKVLKRKKSFRKKLGLMLHHTSSKPVLGLHISRRSKRISRSRLSPPTSVVTRLLPQTKQADRHFVYVTELFKDGSDVHLDHHQQELDGHEFSKECAGSYNSLMSASDKSMDSPSSSSNDEVDRKAEAFISNFHHQIKLQKQRSISEYREMLARSIS